MCSFRRIRNARAYKKENAIDTIMRRRKGFYPLSKPFSAPVFTALQEKAIIMMTPLMRQDMEGRMKICEDMTK